ncbi:uncharacterized protein LOC132949153 [Metopolophium dirhodum]|uniref:uncharacterized protein LOC132949153 n=1 Tax=Metopolophium dirhodum TaxID=44670 RepID=UPI002990506F|nr:uncharacterized protein LOC132949153 [Metopolophium dirhodum]
MTRLSSGRFVVTLPFLKSSPLLGDSKTLAFQRFKALKYRLIRNKNLQAQYAEFMHDYLTAGHMELIPPSELGNPYHYYIPHHCVLKPDSLTTKLRVVFNASAKTSAGISLNESMHTGPKYCNMIFKSYCSDLDSGTLRTVRELATVDGATWPLASSVLLNDTFVDEVLTGANTIEEAPQCQSQLISLCAIEQFQLRKWASNNSQILQTVAEEDRAISPSVLLDTSEQSDLRGLKLVSKPISETGKNQNWKKLETGLGDSSCRYSGNFDSYNEICHKDVVKIKKLPKECTAFVFDGVVCNKDYEITYAWIPEDLDHLKSLVDFEDGIHNVYLFYKHRTLEDWSDALFSGDFKIEAQKVQEFIGKYAVKGLILNGMEYPALENCESDFYKKFTDYVTDIKTTNPDLEIGFYLSARTLILSVNKELNSTWFDFCKMNEVLDFYVIEFATFNECCDVFLHGGITPMESKDPAVMTLTKFATALKQSTIAKEKMYFEFLISPISKPKEKANLLPCQYSYNEYCEYREIYKGKWCVDDQDILYEKGKFAKKYSKGFIGRDIDLVDRDNKCECDNKYITFYMMLKGYTDAIDKLTCIALS